MQPKTTKAQAAADQKRSRCRTQSPSTSPKKHARAEDDTDVKKAAAQAPPPPQSTSLSRPSSASSSKVTAESLLEGTIPFVRKTKDSDFDPSKHIKIICWNVAGLRGLLNKSKDLENLAAKEQPDVICLQETKLSDDGGKTDFEKLGALPGYSHCDSISTAKKGYSGVRTYVKKSLDCVNSFGFDPKSPKSHDPEGRVVTTNVYNLAVVNSYIPNSGMKLDRLDYRTKTFDAQVRAYLNALNSAPGSNVIWTGDLNVAERDYDRYFATNWKAMQQQAGFTPDERASFRKTLHECKMVDAFRHLYPNAQKCYTFWSTRFNGRATNSGWRLDYFVVSATLASKIVDCFVMPQITSSDHSPLVLWLARH